MRNELLRKNPAQLVRHFFGALLDRPLNRVYYRENLPAVAINQILATRAS